MSTYYLIVTNKEYDTIQNKINENKSVFIIFKNLISINENYCNGEILLVLNLIDIAKKSH